MVRRYNITQGAKTTAGGVVSTTNQFSKTKGVPLALEGDPVDCPACNTKGRIKCVGPRLHSVFNGRQFALSDDLCICNCDPPPKLAAIQQHMFQTIDDSPSETSWPSSNQLTASTMPQGTHDLAFEVKDAAGQPLSGYPYLIELSGGKRIEGTTDRHGMTRKVGAMSDEQANLIVYAPDHSPVDPNWDR